MLNEQKRISLINWALNELAQEDLIPDLFALNTANVGKFISAKEIIIQLVSDVENAMKGNQ